LKYTYKTQGVCSRLMHITLDEEERVTELRIEGGCSGNLQGLSAMVKGQRAREVIDRLEGIRCGSKATSCPDQLSKALTLALDGKNNGS